MPKPRRYVITPLPWWAKNIRDMRARLGLSQNAFAKKLCCSSMTLSRWERGLIKPPPDGLISIGKIAGPPLGLRFWRMAGIDPSAVKRMLDPGKEKGQLEKRRRR